MKTCLDPDRLHVSLAGSGDPWKALTRFRLRLLRSLHDGLPLSRIARTAGKTSEQIKRELDPIAEVNLLHKHGDQYTPTFFIADAAETRKVVAHAAECGQSLADHLALSWSLIEEKYSGLSMSQSISIRDMGFLLVGAHILDIGLLEALKHNGTLLEPAPARPSPTRPKARFYFYMIEGLRRDLGPYGLNDTALQWPHWSLLTFGQDWIDDMSNTARSTFEDTCQELIHSEEIFNPHALAGRLRIPIFNEADTTQWLAFTRDCSKNLLTIYLAKASELRQLFSTLRASSNAPHSFSEFFCWYDHIAYAHAIDTLEAQRLIIIPPTRFTAALWHAATPISGCIL